jgi:hypothetical protein
MSIEPMDEIPAEVQEEPTRPIRELPANVQERLTSWKRGRQIIGTTAHNLLGLLGILGSLVALAGLPGVWTKSATIITGFSIAAMTLWNPRREYMKFSKAWRVLDDAALRFKFGRASLDDLFDAMARGEAIIEEADALSGDSSADMLKGSLDHSRSWISSTGSASRQQRSKPKKRASEPASRRRATPREPGDGSSGGQ